jgi:hypothetical protein
MQAHTVLFKDARLIGSGVDWLTLTGKDGEICEALVLHGERIAESRRACGYLITAQNTQGYTGYGIEGCSYGTRQDGAYLRVSGDTARQEVHTLGVLGANVTRADLQITVEMPRDEKEYARTFVDRYREAQGNSNGKTGLGTRCIDDASKGVTAYLGERTAASYCRVYDKHRESRGAYPPGTYRAEVEYKRRSASPLVETLAWYGFDDDAVTSMVLRTFMQKKVRIDLRERVEVNPPIVTRVTSDIDRKLAWLAAVPAKVVRELYDLGYGTEAAQALYGWMMPEVTGEGH